MLDFPILMVHACSIVILTGVFYACFRVHEKMCFLTNFVSKVEMNKLHLFFLIFMCFVLLKQTGFLKIAIANLLSTVI